MYVCVWREGGKNEGTVEDPVEKKSAQYKQIWSH